jgi:hypothetical protein
MYSDCEHEIKPVTTGHRVTLTYNLYTPANSSQDNEGSAASAATAAASAAHESAFGTHLSTAVKDPTWYPEGVTLGFVLEHGYAVKPLDIPLRRLAKSEEQGYEAPSVDGGCRARQPTNMPISIEPGSLKGSDLQLYRAARALGLEVEIVPVMSLDKLTATELSGDVSPGPLPTSKLALLKSFKDDPISKYRTWDRYDNDWVEFLQNCLKERCAAYVNGPLVWVKRPGKQHLKYCGPVTEYQGNDGYVACFYAAAAVLLVVLPPAGSPTRQV